MKKLVENQWSTGGEDSWYLPLDLDKSRFSSLKVANHQPYAEQFEYAKGTPHLPTNCAWLTTYVGGNHDHGINALVAAEALLDKPTDGFCCYLQQNIPVRK